MRISDWSSDVCSSDLGTFEYWVDLLCVPDAQKVDALLPALRDVTEYRQRVGHDVCSVPAVVPRLRRNDALRGAEDQTDRKSVAEGKSVAVRLVPGGRRIIKKKQNNSKPNRHSS